MDTDTDEFVATLREEFGEQFRSCVEYRPSSSTIHYLRPDIERSSADARLVRIEELYHAERLSARPIVEDPDLGALSVSIHLFDGAVVVHFVAEGGYVIGVSFSLAVGRDLTALVVTCADALYGETPPALDWPT